MAMVVKTTVPLWRVPWLTRRYLSNSFIIWPTVTSSGMQTPILEDLSAYLLREHGIIMAPEDITAEALPFISFRDETPMLYGDPELRESMGLDDHTRAVMSSNGVIHEMWTPTLAGIPTEGWRND